MIGSAKLLIDFVSCLSTRFVDIGTDGIPHLIGAGLATHIACKLTAFLKCFANAVHNKIMGSLLAKEIEPDPDLSRGKPDPEGIVKGLSRLKVRPDQALYVGDTPIDIQASHAAGVRAVSVLTGAADSALLSAYEPDRLISSHARLPAIVTAAN